MKNPFSTPPRPDTPFNDSSLPCDDSSPPDVTWLNVAEAVGKRLQMETHGQQPDRAQRLRTRSRNGLCMALIVLHSIYPIHQLHFSITPAHGEIPIFVEMLVSAMPLFMDRNRATDMFLDLPSVSLHPPQVSIIPCHPDRAVTCKASKYHQHPRTNRTMAVRPHPHTPSSVPHARNPLPHPCPTIPKLNL
ncbi:uncharacterized protein CLUP02_03895 [Colletotrichum lupini]|uniref:Uncharacterized protein n=1 Tax=Colletotrichum lupini TaxID=145971 RepID=A0A9Q8SJP7_9PEZI|nr:uncharacterized protein CLUP02_03895 [Colletotrichum lupini]UQC78418.1 hypothetical protein CLUP02_03895 [Colletotrichum lupini]